MQEACKRETLTDLDQRQRNLRGEGGRLKGELIEAAMRILDAQPDAQLSLRMVAKEARIAAPSIYRQFPDAQTMMTEIIRSCWSIMSEEMARAAHDANPETAFDELKAKMRGYVRYAMGRPSRYKLLFVSPPIDPEENDLPGLLRPAFRSVRATVTKMATAGVKLPVGDDFSTALLILSVTHGRIALALLSPQREGNNADSVEHFIFETMDQLFMLGR